MKITWSAANVPAVQVLIEETFTIEVEEQELDLLRLTRATTQSKLAVSMLVVWTASNSLSRSDSLLAVALLSASQSDSSDGAFFESRFSLKAWKKRNGKWLAVWRGRNRANQ